MPIMNSGGGGLCKKMERGRDLSNASSELCIEVVRSKAIKDKHEYIKEGVWVVREHVAGMYVQ